MNAPVIPSVIDHHQNRLKIYQYCRPNYMSKTFGFQRINNILSQFCTLSIVLSLINYVQNCDSYINIALSKAFIS
jgi:hypothetical protein